METILATVLSAVITGGVTLCGVLIANSKAQAVTENKLENLTRTVDKHNQVIERTYRLEARCDVLEEDIRVANHRIADLEGTQGQAPRYTSKVINGQ